MSPGQFWRSTPRITNLFVQGYIRRRAWAAYHGSAPANFKDITLDDLMGIRREPKVMSPEQMQANMHRIMVGVNAMRKAKGLDDGE